jgi:hypothetical protein
MAMDSNERSLHLGLRRRQGHLESIAKANRKTYSLGKGVGLMGGLGSVWLLCIANPAVGAIVGAIALVNYAVASMQETEKTGEYRPLLGRKSLASLAMGLDRQGASQPPSVTIEDDALYLDDLELGEWLLLRTAMPQTVAFLSNYPEETRDEVMELAATEAYRTYGYMFRAEPDTRHQMKSEAVGQYAFQAVKEQADYLRNGAAGSPADIGIQTRLGAIAVPAVEVGPGLNQAIALTPQSSKPSIAESLAANVQSTLIVGMPGSGKGFLLAMSIREIKRLHPDIQVWGIDPKGAASEAWYWELCDRYLPLCLDPFASIEEVKEATNLIGALIRDFVDMGDRPKLLVIDEALFLKEKSPAWFKQLMTGFNAMCSIGRESRQYGWLISQSPNAEDYGISGTLRNVYRRIALVHKSNVGLTTSTSTFFSGKPSNELLAKTGRVFYDSSVDVWDVVPQWVQPTEPINPVANPNPERKPAGESRRAMLERSLQKDSAPTKAISEPEDEKPNLSEDKIMAIALELEEWIAENSTIERKDYYVRFHAHRKGLSRPNFRYLLTLIEE